MIKTIIAKYTQGVIKPADHLNLSEGQEVKITIETHTPQESNWSKIAAVLEEADAMKLPEKTHEQILSDLKEYRETT